MVEYKYIYIIDKKGVSNDFSWGFHVYINKVWPPEDYVLKVHMKLLAGAGHWKQPYYK